MLFAFQLIALARRRLYGVSLARLVRCARFGRTGRGCPRDVVLAASMEDSSGQLTK